MTLAYALAPGPFRPYTAPFAGPSGGKLSVRATKAGALPFVGEFPLTKVTDRSQWKAAASSFKPGEGEASRVLDGNPSTFWHSQYSPTKVAGPHSIVVDMNAPLKLNAVSLTPRQDGSNGRAREYELYMSESDGNWGEPAFKGRLRDENADQTLGLPKPRTARYLKFVIKSNYSRDDIASLAEIDVTEAN